jgi:hypothetical protein
MKELLKVAVIYLILYFIFTLICGIIKVEMMLEYVDKAILPITRLSSYVSTIISILVVILYFIAITGSAYCILWLFGSKPEYGVYAKAIKWFVLFYALNELIKTIMFIGVFKIDSNYVINSVDSIDKLLNNNNWHIKSYITDCITFLFSLFSFIFVLVRKSKKIKILDVTIVALLLIIIFVVTHRDFLDFIN